MNVYEKLTDARVKFLERNVKPSGKNTYAGYVYFDLNDILPVVNQINKELKVAVVVRFEATMAYLDFINSEKPDEVVTFSSPMSSATLKGCHEVQNLGAVESYIKRYLYQNCYEIAEHDVLDSTMDGEDVGGKPKNTPESDNPSERLSRMLVRYGKYISHDVMSQCSAALNGNGDVVEMEERLSSYLTKKRVLTA